MKSFRGEDVILWILKMSAITAHNTVNIEARTGY